MIISATVIHENGHHYTAVRTGEKQQELRVNAKLDGSGSAINGGELLFLALATCYCNDIYREAAERGVPVTSVRVEVTGWFGRKGEAAEDIRYRASLTSSGTEDEVLALMRHTDSVAEIHNTLRQANQVVLTECQFVQQD